MEVSQILSELQCFLEISDVENLEVNIMLVDQSNSRKSRYCGYMLKIKNEDILPSVMKTIEYLTTQLEMRQLSEYDLVASVDDTTQTIEKNQVVFGDDILSKMTLQYNETNTVTDNTDLTKVDFIVMQICVGDNDPAPDRCTKLKVSQSGIMNAKEWDQCQGKHSRWSRSSSSYGRSRFYAGRARQSPRQCGKAISRNKPTIGGVSNMAG